MTKIELAWKWLKPGAAVPVDIKTTTELLDVCKEMAALIENQAAALKTAEDLIAQKDVEIHTLQEFVSQKSIDLAFLRGDLLQAGQREDEHAHQYNEMVAEYDNTIKTLREDVVQKNVTIGILLSERK